MSCPPAPHVFCEKILIPLYEAKALLYVWALEDAQSNAISKTLPFSQRRRDRATQNGG